MHSHSSFLNDKRIGSFGVSKILLALILIGIFVSLHDDTSNLDTISASPVLTSIMANRIPIDVEESISIIKALNKSTIYIVKVKFTDTNSRSITKRKEYAVWS